VGRDDEVGAGGESVPVSGVWLEFVAMSRQVTARILMDFLFCCCDLPADTVLFHFELRAILAVEDVVCVGDVFFELSCYFPLCVVALGRRRGEETSGCDFLCIPEDLLSPPFQFSVPRRRGKAADEGSCRVSLVLAL
jgi:hypothetical protein